jgi:hypothetical protein
LAEANSQYQSFELEKRNMGLVGSCAAVAGTSEWQHSGTPTYSQSEVAVKLQVCRDTGHPIGALIRPDSIMQY